MKPHFTCLLYFTIVDHVAAVLQAWQYLGTTQADNEQEPSAIAALKKYTCRFVTVLY